VHAKQVAECIFSYLDLVWCTYPIVSSMNSSLTVIWW